MKIEEIMQSKNKLESMKKDIEEKIQELSKIENSINEQNKTIKKVANTLEKEISDYLEKESFIKFFEKPYALIPYGKNKLLIVVPKFVKGFQVGWLWKETDNFLIYQLDQYSSWLGDVPSDLMNELNLEEPIKVEIIGENVFFDSSQKDEVKKKFRKHLKEFTENSARIIKGHEFQVIADMVSHNTLPFKPTPVSESDKREPKSNIKLRSYQKPAYNKFLECGAIGLFHPTGAGKSFVSLLALDTIKGKKAIIVPTRSLVEQWNYYLETYLPNYKNEIIICTYQGFKQFNIEFELVIFDECQRLPANTFSKLALIKTKYRIGLSASPHREDNRESYIFALTGFPVGLNWETYMKEVNRKYHPIYVHIVNTSLQKEKKVIELTNKNKRTLIFSDRLDLGKQTANKLGVPFIYGETRERLRIIEENPVVVISRVGDLGISIKNLDQIIEMDFLFGSRQQELQRTGRLMHSESSKTRHDIIMTQEELDSYGKRLWSLQEKGFKINILEDLQKKK